MSALLLVGCTALSAPKLENSRLYLLEMQAMPPPAQARHDRVLAVAMPRARPGFDTPQMAYRNRTHELQYFAVNRWADTPQQMLLPLLIQALEQGGGFRAIVQTPGALPADLRLEVDLVRLQQDFMTHPSTMQMVVRAQLSNVHDRKVLAVKWFEKIQETPSDDAYGGVIAANQILQQMLGELSEFCIRAAGDMPTAGLN
ncbi:ABC-type transport auxiliary lipoprotein family protein [Ferrigenium sp. UT5]|uniref:ABC-type transport auxiliary lipoprotein family protein n=1 Tax=Ferrigenium sp. UT5 TaxID=3242105 RepID=UPI00354EC445